MRHQDLYLLAIAKTRLQQQQQFSMSMQLAIGGLLSKEGAKAGKMLEDSITQLDKLMGDRGNVLGGAAEKVLAQVGDEPPPPPAKKAPVTQKQAVKVIRKLDMLMTKLTGRPVRNPAGQYEEGQAPNAYDASTPF